MFNLDDADLPKRILGCGDGPASFNAEMRARGGNVVSVDPVYAFSGTEIEERIQEVAPVVMGQVRGHADDFVWSSIPSPDALEETRMRAMRRFLDDYESGKTEGRYLEASLPVLPFEDGSFDLALCSHFLFLYSDQVDLETHLNGLRELLRVAAEVRVYPMVALNGQPSPHLEPVMETLATEEVDVRREPVEYEFQRGATEMLVLGRRP